MLWSGPPFSYHHHSLGMDRIGQTGHRSIGARPSYAPPSALSPSSDPIHRPRARLAIRDLAAAALELIASRHSGRWHQCKHARSLLVATRRRHCLARRSPPPASGAARRTTTSSRRTAAPRGLLLRRRQQSVSHSYTRLLRSSHQGGGASGICKHVWSIGGRGN